MSKVFRFLGLILLLAILVDRDYEASVQFLANVGPWTALSFVGGLFFSAWVSWNVARLFSHPVGLWREPKLDADEDAVWGQWANRSKVVFGGRLSLTTKRLIFTAGKFESRAGDWSVDRNDIESSIADPTKVRFLFFSGQRLHVKLRNGSEQTFLIMDAIAAASEVSRQLGA